MRMQSIHRRSGVTLTECLVAMFVMALGMLALLTLFPLGAIQIGQALKDDRCAQTSAQADAYLRAYWRTEVAERMAIPNGQSNDPFVWAMDDPNLMAKNGPISAVTAASPPYSPPNAPTAYAGLYRSQYLGAGYILPTGATVPAVGGGIPVDPNADLNTDIVRQPRLAIDLPSVAYVSNGTRTNVPSYPVYIDPLGQLARGNSQENVWVGRSSYTGICPLLIPRRSLVSTPTFATAYPNFALTDDMTFMPNGAPNRFATLERQGRYNWAAIVQRPRNDVPSTATLSVMVFDGRPALISNQFDEMVLPESQTAPAQTLNIGERSINIMLPPRPGNESVLVRKGGWILDGSIGRVNLFFNMPPPANQIEGIHYIYVRTANFYRITGVTEGAPITVTGVTYTPYTLDLETPIKPLWNGATKYTDTGAPLSMNGQVYLFAGLAEVFEKTVLAPDTIYVP